MKIRRQTKLFLAIGVVLLLLLAVPYYLATFGYRRDQSGRLHAGMTLEEFCSVLTEQGTPLKLYPGRFIEVRESSTNFFPGREFSLEVDDSGRLETLDIKHPTTLQVLSHWWTMSRVYLNL